MSIDIAAAVLDAKIQIAVAGGLIIGVMVAVKAVDWIQAVIANRTIAREAAYEAQMDNEWRWGGTDEY